MRNNGLKLSRRDFRNLCNGFLSREEPVEKDKILTVYENRIKDFAIDLGLDLKINEIKKIANESVISWHNYVEIDPEAIPLLKKLKNEKCLALITNFDHPPYIYLVLSKYKLMEYFKYITISGEIGIKKPDPRIFDKPLEKFELKPQEVLYIGDSSEDIEGSLKAGIKPILIQRQNFKKRLIGNDYFSNKKVKEKELTINNLNLIPFKTISRLGELYQILGLLSTS